MSSLVHVLSVNKFRYTLLTRIWPLCFACFMASQALYGSGADRHPFADVWFDIGSWLCFGILVVSAIIPERLWLRTISGLGVIGLTLARAGWFFDPEFIAGQRVFAASVYALAMVSSLGWVMAADFAVVSAKMRKQV